MRYPTPIFPRLWEWPRPPWKSSCTSCGSVTGACCGMKSRARSEIPRTWKTRSDTYVRPSPPELSNSDEKFGGALGLDPEYDQEPGKMRQVRRHHATRHRNLRELPLTRGVRS